MTQGGGGSRHCEARSAEAIQQCGGGFDWIASPPAEARNDGAGGVLPDYNTISSLTRCRK
jgi:hypothetical protein